MTWTETNLGLGSSLVLIDVAYHLFHRGETGVGLGGRLLRHLGLVTGIDRMLVGFVGLTGRQPDTFRCPRVRVLDHLAVGCGELIEFVDAVPDGRRLPLHVLLAGKGIQMAPEALVGIWLQRLFAAGASGLRSRILVSRGRRSRLRILVLLRTLGQLAGGGWILRGRAGLLRKGRKREHGG